MDDSVNMNSQVPNISDIFHPERPGKAGHRVWLTSVLWGVKRLPTFDSKSLEDDGL